MRDLVDVDIEYGGRKICISGFEDDAYYQNAAQNIASNDLYTAILVHHVPLGATIIDVGANVGVTTAIADAFVRDASIVSVEPSSVFCCLERTCARNNMKKQRSINCCVGAADGTTTFVNALNDSSGSHIGATDAPPISMRSLDSLAAELDLTRCDFVKIDVEGFEAGVLDGMREINARMQPLIFMEFNAFCLTAYGNVSPRSFIERIVGEFGCFLARTVGTDLQICRANDIIPFLHRNMTARGCVDDIVFSANPARIAAFRLE